MKITSLSKSFDRKVIENFSYDFPEKGLFLIRGASGKGKTTLLRLIAGLEKPDSGKIELEGKKISMVFQEPRLIPHLSLLENVLLVKNERNLPLANEILTELRLADSAAKFPHELSGGMRLRGGIARSLYYGGDIYLWDEPTKELDPENRKKVISLAKRIAENHLLIAVTHDPDFTDGVEIFI